MPSKKPKTSQAALSRAVTRQRPKPKAATASAKSARGTVYQLKITLNDIRPPIWRRVQAKNCTLADLHDIIQIIFGWEDYHLHVFEIGDEQYGDPDQWDSDFLGDPGTGNECKLKLSQIVGQNVKKFRYQYDMGDSWRHTIQVEKTLSAEPGVKYPRCITGSRACPPEDCGGPWGYANFVEAAQNPKHKQHSELLEWFGGEFDPEKFDLAAVNKELQEV